MASIGFIWNFNLGATTRVGLSVTSPRTSFVGLWAFLYYPLRGCSAIS